MFKYSFESTGVHPSLSSKINQIVIGRDDLAENFENLNLSGESAQMAMSDQFGNGAQGYQRENEGQEVSPVKLDQ